MTLPELCLQAMEESRTSYMDKLRQSGLPKPFIQQVSAEFSAVGNTIFSLNKAFLSGSSLKEFCKRENLSCKIPQCLPGIKSLHRHQEEAIRTIVQGECTVISTGTGSGKTETFLIPVLDLCLKIHSPGIKAILVYPTNALAGDQTRRIRAAAKEADVKCSLFTSETSWDEQKKLIATPPDILITNYVMLDRLLTNPKHSGIWRYAAEQARYLVFDEIHTFKGNRATDVRLLICRLRAQLPKLTCVGCSATLSTGEGLRERREEKRFIRSFFSIQESQPIHCIHAQYKQLEPEKETDPRVVWLKDMLYGGCRTLNELRDGLEERGFPMSEEELKRYLLDLNQPTGNPALDYRMHLFVRPTDGGLFRCISCRRHYSTSLHHRCADCGGMLLPVYCKDPTCLVGAVANGFLTFPTFEKKTELTTLLDMDGLFKTAVMIAFDQWYETPDGIKVIPHPQGAHHLHYQLDLSGADVVNQKNMQSNSAYDLLLRILNKCNSPEQRRILTFVNSKENSGRISANLGSRMIDKFLDWAAHVFLFEHPNLSLPEFMQKMENELDLLHLCRGEEILADFPLWISKLLNAPREYGTQLCPMEEGAPPLSLEEKELLKTLVEDRFFGRDSVVSEGKLLRVGNGAYKRKRVAVLEVGAAGVLHDNCGWDVLTLGEGARRYQEIENREILLSGLCEKGFVCRHIKTVKAQEIPYFYVNMNRIAISSTRGRPTVTLADLARRYLYFSDVHNADRPLEEKKRVENEFRCGKEIQVLVCTSTLEMGVDIGGLNLVCLYGVPPDPASYAQRAGRAGRNANRFGGIFVLCAEDSNHDQYFLDQPRQMIDGVLHPPRFSLENKHELRRFVCEDLLPLPFNEDLSALAQRLEAVYDLPVSASFLEEAQRGLAGQTIQKLYDDGVLPTFAFNRDMIVAIDADEPNNNKNVLERREPWQACQQFIPDTKLYMGSQHYCLLPDKEQIHREIIECPLLKQSFISYSRLLAKKQQADEEEREFVSSTYTVWQWSRKEKTVCHIQELYVEHGVLELFFLGAKFKDGSNDTPNNLCGYRRERSGFLVRLDIARMDASYGFSLCAALQRAIEEEFGYGEAEIGVVTNDKLNDCCVEKQYFSLLLYEKSDSTVDFIELSGQFESRLLPAALRILSECGCKNGCYQCLRAFSNSFYAALLSKDKALDLLSHLCFGTELCTISEKIENIPLPELVALQASVGQIGMGDGKNKQIFKQLASQLTQLLQKSGPHMVTIETKEEYIQNAINGIGKIKEDKEAYALFKFYSVAFEAVGAFCRKESAQEEPATSSDAQTCICVEVERIAPILREKWGAELKLHNKCNEYMNRYQILLDGKADGILEITYSPTKRQYSYSFGNSKRATLLSTEIVDFLKEDPMPNKGRETLLKTMAERSAKLHDWYVTQRSRFSGETTMQREKVLQKSIAIRAQELRDTARWIAGNTEISREECAQRIIHAAAEAGAIASYPMHVEDVELLFPLLDTLRASLAAIASRSAEEQLLFLELKEQFIMAWRQGSFPYFSFAAFGGALWKMSESSCFDSAKLWKTCMNQAHLKLDADPSEIQQSRKQKQVNFTHWYEERRGEIVEQLHCKHIFIRPIVFDLLTFLDEKEETLAKETLWKLERRQIQPQEGMCEITGVGAFLCSPMESGGWRVEYLNLPESMLPSVLFAVGDNSHRTHLHTEEIIPKVREVLETAREEVDLMCPWVNDKVLQGYYDLLEAALKRGVTVKIAYGMGHQSDSRFIHSKNAMQKFADKFSNWKDQIHILEGNSHYKLLICDKTVCIYGSYNFLSNDLGGNMGEDAPWEEGCELSRSLREITERRRDYFTF